MTENAAVFNPKQLQRFRAVVWDSVSGDVLTTSPRAKGYHVLVSIDEKSYLPVERLLPWMKPKDIRMGEDHPLVWSHCVGNGRALYSALGHTASSYLEPQHQQLLAGAMAWAAGLEGPVCVAGEERQ